jgi:hypothetical protein
MADNGQDCCYQECLRAVKFAGALTGLCRCMYGEEMSARLVLRHSLVPYTTLGTIFIGLTIWMFVISMRSGKWVPLKPGSYSVEYIHCKLQWAFGTASALRME